MKIIVNEREYERRRKKETNKQNERDRDFDPNTSINNGIFSNVTNFSVWAQNFMVNRIENLGTRALKKG